MSKFNKLEKLAAATVAGAKKPVEEEQQVKEAADTKSLAVKFLQCMPANIKLIHVKTKSYAQHMALDDAFDDLNEALDTFYECVQGHYVIKTGSRIPLSDKSYQFQSPDDKDVLSAVKDMAKGFKSAAAEVTDGDSALESARDDVTNTFNQLAYRLTLK